MTGLARMYPILVQSFNSLNLVIFSCPNPKLFLSAPIANTKLRAGRASAPVRAVEYAGATNCGGKAFVFGPGA